MSPRVPGFRGPGGPGVGGPRYRGLGFRGVPGSGVRVDPGRVSRSGPRVQGIVRDHTGARARAVPSLWTPCHRVPRPFLIKPIELRSRSDQRSDHPNLIHGIIMGMLPY